MRGKHRRWSRRAPFVAGMAVTLLTGLPVPSPLAPPAGAASFQAEVIVEITQVHEMQCPDDDCPGDYYTWTYIDGERFRSQGEIESAGFTLADLNRTDWTFRKLIDGGKDTVDIAIDLMDSDIGADPNGDDVMDISAGDDQLHLTLDLVTGNLTGDVQARPGELATSFGTPGGSPMAQIFFRVTSSLTRDTDGDGIPDGAELKGFWDDNRTVFTPLHQMGADPCRKTIAVEVDYMVRPFGTHTHRPTDGAVDEITAMFDNAPVNAVAAADCPFRDAGFPRKATGIDMIIDRDSRFNLIEEQEAMSLDALPFVGIANFTPGRGKYFHYALFVHNQAPGDDTSGRCCVNDRHFIVSLGEWTGGAGTDREQAGTFVHELGHALGLGHGGHEETNHKPNYLSAMNYAFQFGIPTTGGTSILDYSREKLPKPAEQLVENSLMEAPSGCIGSPNLGTTWRNAEGYRVACLGNEQLDWDGDGSISSVTRNIDVNWDGICTTPGANGERDTGLEDDDTTYLARVGEEWKLEAVAGGPDHTCDSTVNADDPNTETAADDEKAKVPGGDEVNTGDVEPTPLAGSEDWSRLIYRGVASPGANRPSVDHGPDITFREARELQGVFTSPDLKAAKTVDKADVAPGETLTYTATAENVGLGIATTVQMTDTLPDGTVVGRSLPQIRRGGSRSETFTHTVPCSAADGTPVVNAVALSSRNVLGGAEPITANNTASASSTVRRPVVTLAKTATPSAGPAEAVTYRLTFENTGSGSAAGVVVKDTLPAGMYYSPALDLGAGPRPTSVVLNADGSRTLTWSVGALAGSATAQTIEFTARTSLLAAGGTTLSNAASVEFSSAGGCVYAPATAAAATTVAGAPPSGDPIGPGHWANHPEEWTPEIRARIHATDQRFDGADGTAPDGQLSPAEVAAVYEPARGQPETLRIHLLSAYFNLATRRVSADTAISSRTADRLQLGAVRSAAIAAMATVVLPFDPSTAGRYSDVTTVLDEINANRSPRY